MNLTIQHFGLRSTDRLDTRVEKGLLPLTSRLRMENAVVILAQDHKRSPAFRASIGIATPGPDLFIQARGHTIEAAFRQALSDLNRKLDARDRKRIKRIRSPKPKPALQRRRPSLRAAR